MLVVERPEARIVVQAFRRRDRGASLVEIQAWLAANGIERSISGVESMLRSRMYLGEIHFGDLHNLNAHEPIIKDRALFERVQRRTVSRGRQARSERLLARLGVLRCGTCGSRMVINSYTGSYRCGDTSANRCQRRAAVKADRVEEMVLDAVRAYSATADAHGRASRKQQIREADEAIGRANADLDDTIRQLGELALLGRLASQEALEKLAKTLDNAHSARARLGDGGASDVIGPDEIDKLREPAKRLAAWRRLITDTVESVTVAPAMTAEGPLGPSPDRHQVPGPAPISKPPAAASRASVDTLRSYDSRNSADRRGVGRRRRARLPQPREPAARDRRFGTTVCVSEQGQLCPGWRLAACGSGGASAVSAEVVDACPIWWGRRLPVP